MSLILNSYHFGRFFKQNFIKKIVQLKRRRPENDKMIAFRQIYINYTY